MTEITQLVGFSYVDHCGLVQSDDDIKANHSQTQPTVMKREYFIRITGGYLAPEKSA